MMLLLLNSLAALFLVAAAAIFAVDGFFWLIDRYCRFHIGRWPDQQAWEDAVYRIAKKWSRKTPTVKITDNSRYVLLDMLSGRYRSQSIQSWQNAAIILGLWEKGDHDGARASAARFLESTGNWRKPPVAVDACMLAYAILKTAEDTAAVKPAMDFMISLVERNTDEQGLIAYTNKHDPNRYVDTIGLVCPFLALYSRVYHCPRYEALAFSQLKFYHDHGLLAETNLPNHAVNGQTRLPLGVYGWGRGAAWYVLGLADTYPELSSDTNRAAVRMWISDAAQSYCAFQRDDGGFGSILQIDASYDSSATAALAWFYATCAELLDSAAYADRADRCLQKLKTVTRITGKIDWCQGDTKGIGIFAQTYDIMPFAQGLALRAMEIRRKARKHGTEIQN